MDWKEKMRQGMLMMAEACEESTYDAEGGCSVCPFGDICGPIPYDPDCWKGYLMKQKDKNVI